MKPAKLLVEGEEARQRLLRGVSRLAKAVGVTYGPFGRAVVLEQEWAPPTFTRDGVTVAKSVELEDPLENLGSQLLRHAALRTGEEAGDGTTTSILVGAALVREGLKEVAAGTPPTLLVEGLERGAAKALAALGEQRLEASPERLLAVARVASRSPEAARRVVEALERAGEEGEVEVEEGQALETRLVEERHRFVTAGYHPGLEPLWERLEEATVVVGEQFESAEALKPLWPFPALLLMGRLSEGVRTWLREVRHRGVPVVACYPPGMGLGHGDALRGFLEDVAALTGGEAYGGYGPPLPGRARVAFQGERVYLEVAPSPGLRAHREEVRQAWRRATSAHLKGILRKRLAFLAEPLVRLQVGGGSREAIRESLFLYEDALKAAQGARAEGVLPGGGSALLHAARSLDTQVPGERALARALEEPVRWLLANAGLEAAPRLRLLRETPPGTYWDPFSDLPARAEEKGVMDAYLAVKTALVAAKDVAQALLLTEGILVEKAAFWR